jgi:TolB-like protein
MAQLFEELKRRKVFRVGVSYAIAGWLLVEVSSVVLPTFEAPAWVMQVLTFLVLLAFPLVLVMAWAFEITPDGIVRDKGADSVPPTADPAGRKRDVAIIGLLVAAVLFLVIDGYLLDTEQAPVRATAAKVPVAEPKPAEASTKREQSIAVLPFVNMSPDPSREYFSDGLSEEILNLLAKVPDLKVIARTSSFAFKGKNEDVRTIGRTLGVSTVLEGSVRMAGDRVRITAQLVDASTGAHIFSESYDRTLTDIFEVQDSVAAEILAALQIHVGTALTRGRPTENADAYALFLEARAALNRYDDSRSIELLREAIELDPMFAEAYEQLALSFWYRSATDMDAAGAQRGQHDAAAKALAIDPNLLFAQALFEAGKQEDTSHARQIEAFERVLREMPNHEDALDTLFWKLMVSGYFQEALRVSEGFVDLDPLSPVAHFDLARALVSIGRRSEALRSLKLVEQLGVSLATWELGFFNLSDGRDEEAIAHFQSYLLEERLPVDWARELVLGARDPATGQAHIADQLQQVGSVSAPLVLGGNSRFYLAFGFLDRYIDLLFENGLSDTIWSHAESLLFTGTADRRSGFTAHPRYIEVAETFGLIELWEQRGPPDFCEELDGQWVCE